MKRNTIGIRVSSVILAAALVLATIAVPPSQESKSSADAVSLPNIDKIIDDIKLDTSNRSKSTFNILEITANPGEGQLGWYIGGYEPLNVLNEHEELAKLTQEQRLEYMNGNARRAKFGALLGNALASYAPYKETFTWEGKPGTVLPLDLVNKVPVTTVRSGSSSLPAGTKFRPVFNYKYGGDGDKYKFTDGALVYATTSSLEGKTIDYRVNATFTSIDIDNHATDGTFGAGVYELKDGVYTYYGKWGVDGTIIYTDGEYYAVTEWEFDETDGDYYVINETAELDNTNGQFTRTYDHYVHDNDASDGETPGQLTESSVNNEPLYVWYDSVLYTGGTFVNNNWFKQYVFDNTSDNLSFSVQTATPGGLTSQMLTQANMVVIVGGDFSGCSAELKKDFDDLIINVNSTKSLVVNFDVTDTWIKDEVKKLNGDVAPTAALVHNKLYVYSGALATQIFHTPIEPTTNFSEVLAGIDEQNLRLEVSGRAKAEWLPVEVTSANAIRHVINYGGESANKKTTLNVLDIEPRTPTGTGNLTAAIVSGWTGGAVTAANITVTNMSIVQFVGKIDDLNETYDLVYFGNSKTGFVLPVEYITANITSTPTYNATLNANANGNYYDTQAAADARAAALATANPTYSYYAFRNGTTGNYYRIRRERTDFNDNNMDGLLYYNVGDTVAVGQKLRGLVATETKTANTTNIMRCPGNDITTPTKTMLNAFAQAGYPMIFADELYVTGKTAPNGDRVDNCTYLYDLMDSVKTKPNVMRSGDIAANRSTFMTYLNLSKPKIQFSDNAPKPPVYTSLASATQNDRTLTYTFYIENATDPTPVTSTYTAALFLDSDASGKFTSAEERNNIEVRQNGKLVPVYSLKSGKENVYTLTCMLPPDYVGIIPWKLTITRNGTPYIHTSETDFTRIAAPKDTAGKPTQVIKVLQIISTTTVVGITLTNNVWLNGAPYTALLNEQRDRGDFDVQVTVVNADGNRNVNGATGLGTLWATNADADTVFTAINNYDMLVLGFTDCYNLTQLNVMNAVLKFAKPENGKSVLFTHDNTSVDNRTDTGGNYYWGYNFNRLLRDQGGLDVFGISNLTAAGNNLGNAVANLKAGTALTAADKTALTGATYRIAYQPKSNKATTLSAVQGYTPYDGMRGHGGVSNNANTYWNGLTVSSATANRPTQVVRQNTGQVTTYPYDLSAATLTVTQTHSQYYMLNMEKEDMVVWYTLGNNNNGHVVPNDVAGAYYIYSFGNIFYSGVGHTGPSTADEAKLFVNTLIAAYRSTGADIIVTPTTDATGNSVLKHLYFPANRIETESSIVLDNSATAYYRFDDTGTAGDYTATYSYFNGTTYIEAQTGVKPVRDPQKGTVAFDVPTDAIDLLADKEAVTIKIAVSKSTGGTTVTGEATFEIRKLGLLDLQ
ncbi:hypothetical protein FACS18949_07850 [Clostridia bacterium]|nr:hypothetical protein FACS18949_07850 [Clostridia bacterium]